MVSRAGARRVARRGERKKANSDCQNMVQSSEREGGARRAARLRWVLGSGCVGRVCGAGGAGGGVGGATAVRARRVGFLYGNLEALAHTLMRAISDI